MPDHTGSAHRCPVVRSPLPAAVHVPLAPAQALCVAYAGLSHEGKTGPSMVDAAVPTISAGISLSSIRNVTRRPLAGAPLYSVVIQLSSLALIVTVGAVTSLVTTYGSSEVQMPSMTYVVVAAVVGAAPSQVTLDKAPRVPVPS